MTRFLEITRLSAKYGKIAALRDLSLNVDKGEIVVIIGANGAGKSTLIRAVIGLHPAKDKTGQIIFNNRDISTLNAEKVVKLGIGIVFERRELFTNLNVRENLLLGAYQRYRADSGNAIRRDILNVYQLFPILKSRGNQGAGTLSGGEQQMLAFGRALMGRPSLLLLDEPSMGLAPIVVREISSVITKLKSQGITILMVEQNTTLALSIGDRGYVIQNGEIVLGDSTRNLLVNERIRGMYLGECG